MILNIMLIIIIKLKKSKMILNDIKYYANNNS